MRILWIPHITWDVPQRARIFCEKLSTEHEIHVTDFDANFSSLKDFISRRYLSNYFYHMKREGSVMIHHIPRITPALFSRRLRELNYKIFRNVVENIIRKYEIECTIGTFLCKPPKVKKLVFDLFDNNPAYWREYRKMDAYAEEIERIEEEYIRKANKIVAASSVLAEKVKSNNVHLIPNGVDIERFRSADGKKVREELGLKGTVVGVIGAHHEFSGLIKVVEAAKKLRNLTFVVVGGGTEVPKAQKLSEKYGLNFVFTGFVNREKIQNYFKAIDIGLLPFPKTKFTDSACPIKLLEYTAAGKPVVSTDLEEVKRMNFSNVILTRDSPNSLAEGIKKAIDLKVEIPREIGTYDITLLTKKYRRVLAG